MPLQGGEHNQSRFTGRVEHYRQFRPGYPRSIVQMLTRECRLNPGSTIVDIAAGTGLFAELFLENGNAVVAIEPNEEMRSACAGLMSRYPDLSVVDGSAEKTGLSSSVANFVTVAQAMHWFDLKLARQEFVRILKPDGWCVVAYNERCRGGDPFHDGYERLLVDFGVDYEAVQRRYVWDDALRSFFNPSPMHKDTFRNSQVLDRDALIGRVLSSSYMPSEGRPGHEELLKAIDQLFAQNQRNGIVQLDYECTVRFGQFSQAGSPAAPSA